MHNAQEVQTGFVENNGTWIYYEMLGQGHPLVLLHGGYMDRRMWDDQFFVLAERYNVVRYDIRGFGKSDLPRRPYADRDDLYALLNFLGIQRTYLLGLSLGGEIALDFALEHPTMVDALILVGSPISGYPHDVMFTPDQLQTMIQQWMPFEQAIQDRDRSRMVEHLMAHPTLVPSPAYPEARQRVRRYLSEYSFVWVLDPAPRQELTPPAYERLAEIHVPTLIIVGANDHFQLHKSADRLAREIAGARRIEIPDTHHMPNMEKPDIFNQIVLDFLRTLS